MQLVGRYELRELIGEGAMAEVWRAYDPGIDRVLAVKLLKPEYRRNPSYVQRFLREAKAAGVLAHPSIVTIYDVGEADGYPYIAMELLDGEALDQVLAREKSLPPERVLAIGVQLASALSYAHLSGVVHRDIKPSNIMLGPDGRSIKILDFGIARVSEADPDRANLEHLKTQIGQVLGTPRYMSPEQALGQSIDGRSDLFSVGAVLYELITGDQAFGATSAATLALQITQMDPTPIPVAAPTCPGGLRFIVEKLLAKRPERRFANGAELSRALAREIKAYDSVAAEDAARGRYVPMHIRLTLGVVTVMAVALVLSMGAILNRQYAAMERIALTSGSSIAAFVASNAALPAVENAAMPPLEQDWTPIQAFIAAASKDQAVRWMTMVDASGVVRGSSAPERLGTRYAPPAGEVIVRKDANVTITDIKLDDGRDGFRFVQPIMYAGKPFGLIEVSISKAELQAAAATSRSLMVALALIILAVVGAITFAMARTLGRPIRRLKQALRDATMGDLDFRISHRRKDEFGDLFDGFNLFATAMQDRLEASERPSGRPQVLDETIIGGPPEPTSTATSTPVDGTPFDPAWRRQSA